jgi:hypothetical protein
LFDRLLTDLMLQDYQAGEVIKKAESKIDIMTYAQTVRQTKSGTNGKITELHENLFTPGGVEDVKISISHAFSIPELDLPSQTATTTLFDHEGNVRATSVMLQ